MAINSLISRIADFGKALGEAPINVAKSIGDISQKTGEFIGQRTEARQESPILKLSRGEIAPNSKEFVDYVASGTPIGGIERTAAKVTKNIAEKAIKRTNIINSAADKFAKNLDEVVKVRKSGNGTIKITRGELEVMKNMGDLKPAVGERYLQNPIRVFEELGEPAKELFYRPVKVAENNAILWKNFYNKEFKNVTKGLSQNNSKRIMQFALGQEDDGLKILQSKGIKVPELKPKEMAAYNYMRQRYDSLLDGLNEARAIIGKEPIPKRDNYITHIKDMNILEQMGFNPVRENIEELLVNKVHRNQPAFQFAKRRTGALKDLELDAFNVFRKYQEKAVDNIQLTPAITKVRELSRNVIDDISPVLRDTAKTNELKKTSQRLQEALRKSRSTGASQNVISQQERNLAEVEKQILESTGEEVVNKFRLKDVAPNAFKYIDQWTDYVAGQKVQSNMPKVLENLMSKLNRNIAFATLSSNVRSALIQPSAIINSVTEIGPKNVSVGIKELIRGQSDFALKNSNVLNGRQFETAIQDIANSALGKTGRLRSQIAELGIKPLQALDNITAQATWLGAYNRAVSQLGKAGKAAFNYADDVVTKTQASAARSDVAKIQRSTAGKVATQFQTFVINDFNRIMRDVAGIGNADMTKKDVIKKSLTYLAGVSMWNSFMEDVLGVPTPFPRPIKALREEGAGEAVKEIGSQVPIVGGAIRFGGSSLGAAVDLTQQVFNKVNGKYSPKSWWEIAGSVFGVPGTAQLRKTIKGVEGLSDGYYVTTKVNGKTRRIKIKITDPVDKVRTLLLGPYSSKTAAEVRETGKRPKK